MLLLIITLLLPPTLTQPSVYLTPSCAFTSHPAGAKWIFDGCADPQNRSIHYSRDWKVCWILCCGDWSESRAWSSPSVLEKCEPKAAASDKKIMIVGIAVGGVFIFLVLGYVIYKLASGNERGRISPQDKLAIIRRNIAGSLVWKSDWGRLQEGLGSHEDFAWRSEECAICLEEGSNTLLDCQHSFHYRCYLEWMKKSKECPLCRSSGISRVTVRCSKCSQKHT